MPAADSARVSITSGSGQDVIGLPTIDDFQWQEGAYDIEDFLRVYDLPQIVKVDSGDYGNFGTGTHVDVGRPFLLTARRSCSKVLAASVYWDDSRQDFVEVGPRLVIPVTYKGWFWYLQDFARAGKTWNNIEQVANARPRPRYMLIRQPVTCYRTQGVLRPGVQRLYRREQLDAGTVLATGDIYSESQPLPKAACCVGLWSALSRRRANREIKYLQCRDADGHDVLLEFNQTGEFLGVGEAGTMLEGAVYRLADVLASCALPTYVKLAQGQPPASPCSFTGLLRLEEIYMEETVIACCLGRSVPTMVEFPTDSDIQFISAVNGPDIFQHDQIAKAMDYCKTNIEHYVTTIKVVQNFYPEHIIKSELGNGLRGRALPDLPEVTADQASEIAESIDTMTTEDISCDEDTDDSQSCCNVALNKYPNDESNYEVIPGELGRQIRCDNRSSQLLVDEEGYLEPLQLSNKNSNKVSVDTAGRVWRSHPTEPQANTDIAKPMHTIFMDRRNKLVLQIENTVTESSDDCPYVPQRQTSLPIPIVHNHLEQIKAKTQSLGRQASYDAPSLLNHNRPKFPSLHTIPIDEFDTGFDAFGRFYDMNKSNDEHSDLKKDSCQRMVYTQQFPNRGKQNPDLETNEGVSAFLETLFDYDNMDFERQSAKLPKHGSLGNVVTHYPRDHQGVFRRPSDATAKITEPSTINSAFSSPDPSLGERNVHSLRLMVPRRESGDLSQEPVVGERNERSQSVFAPIPEPPRFDLSHAEDRLGHEYDNGVPSTPSSDTDVCERRAKRSDSGIYLSRWPDVRPECESPYLSPSEDSWTPPDDISQLSVLDVARCLRYIGIKQALAVRFVEEQVDGKLLQELDDELLREGMPELNAFERKKVLDFTQGWRPKKL